MICRRDTTSRPDKMRRGVLLSASPVDSSRPQKPPCAICDDTGKRIVVGKDGYARVRPCSCGQNTRGDLRAPMPYDLFIEERRATLGIGRLEW